MEQPLAKRKSVDSQGQGGRDPILGGTSWSRKVGGAAAEGRGVTAGQTDTPAGGDRGLGELLVIPAALGEDF